MMWVLDNTHINKRKHTMQTERKIQISFIDNGTEEFPITEVAATFNSLQEAFEHINDPEVHGEEPIDPATTLEDVIKYGNDLGFDVMIRRIWG